jgi:hypothetical protein
MFTTKHVTLTDANPATLFTVPNGFVANIGFVFVANHGGSTNSVQVWWESSGAVPQLYLFGGNNLNAKDNLTLSSGASCPLFVLHSGEVVKAQAGSAGNIEVAVTFDLADRPAGLNNFDDA